MNLRFHTLDVFTDTPLSGNPLAVVLDADALSQRQMQAIAREFNLSETVFVQRATLPEAMARARIFTPLEELPFAGHPTLGTAWLLARLRSKVEAEELTVVLEEGIGPISVRVKPQSPGYAELTVAQAPEWGPPAPDRDTLAAMLGLDAADIGTKECAPRQVSCGLRFLLVPLRAPEMLAGIDVDTGLFACMLRQNWAQGIYVYAQGYEGELRARTFYPGIGEDPATGAAGAALAAALADESSIQTGELQWEVHQGVEMGRPSRLFLSASKHDGHIRAVRAGGHVVGVMQGELHGF
ncbi:MAG: PhzF family phenazine biosynthesis protein [Panacagrimonas sp.]